MATSQAQAIGQHSGRSTAAHRGAVDVALPPTAELFTRTQLVARHPHLLTDDRVTWALRHRARNGLAPAVYESRGGELLLHEPTFIRWFLGLCGRRKPRAARRRSA